MTQENKELLLKDLCARLPYKIAVEDEYGDMLYLDYKDVHFEHYVNNIIEGNIKPYLFPLSSMTEEQKKEIEDTLIEMNLKALSDEINSEDIAAYEIDFYNKHHIDYRCLIPKGLALDATGKNIY